MQLKLTLQAVHKPAFLPFNYQYPLSAAIYKIIQSADKEFAAFLHNTGYQTAGKTFKLFTFSDIKTPFQQSGDRMQLQSGEAELIVCFYMPQAAENFIRGLFIHQQLQIADSKSKSTFEVTQVESRPQPITSGISTYILQPLSPIVTGQKNDRGHYDYRSPEDDDFTECILSNWLEKYKAVYGTDLKAIADLREKIHIAVQPLRQPPQRRLITIKAGTAAATKVRGYTRFGLTVTAPKELMELALGAGLGLYNAQGIGCVQIV